MTEKQDKIHSAEHRTHQPNAEPYPNPVILNSVAATSNVTRSRERKTHNKHRNERIYRFAQKESFMVKGSWIHGNIGEQSVSTVQVEMGVGYSEQDS